MPDFDDPVTALLQEILGAERSEEEVYRKHPELRAELSARLAGVRALHRELDEILPSADSLDARMRSRRRTPKTPDIPGYAIEGVIGTGGMGVVYRARHAALHRTVAIKMLLSGGYAHPSELERFRREAESIAALRHPNIVQVFDAGECDGHPYFVMEFVEGGSLARSLGGSPQPARSSANAIAVLARAVHAAHRSGVSHRDLKPGNILLTDDGTPKIADFGLAQRAEQEGSETLTLPGARIGTPSYMSPEQASGATLKFCPLVDVYALGAILYEMLTGRPPFRGESAAETERQVIRDEPVPPSRLTPKTPRDLETICLTCLQKEPARRYPSAADLADDLDRFLAEIPIRARPIGRLERAMRWSRKRPAAAALILTLATTIAAGSTTAVWLARASEARHTEDLLRRGLSRDAVESALARLPTLRGERRWVEAAAVLEAAHSRLADADDAELTRRFSAAREDLSNSREIDAIRQSYAAANNVGYSYSPAAEAYDRVFVRCGIGRDVPIDLAVERVRGAVIREDLLAALDHAAFVDRVLGDNDGMAWALELARRADPDPWRDRFRTAKEWFDKNALLRLGADAKAPSATALPHQLVLIGVLLSGFGATEETLAPLRDAQRRFPSDFWVNLELANALQSAGKPRESFEFLRAALAVRPDNFVVWTTLGALQRVSGDLQAALRSLEKARELNAGYPTSGYLLAATLSDLGRVDEAMTACERAKAETRKSDEAHGARCSIEVVHGRLLASRSRWAEAAACYTSGTDASFEDATEIRFEALGLALLNDDEATYRGKCAELVALAREGGGRAYLAARALTLQPWPRETVDEIARIAEAELQRNATSFWSLAQRGAIRLRLGDPAGALPLLQSGVDADPQLGTSAATWLWLALAKRSLGQESAALADYHRAADWLDACNGAKPANAIMHLHTWIEAQVLRREFEAGTRRAPRDAGQ